MSSSPEEMVPTRAISWLPETGWLFARISATAASVAFWMPRRMTIGFAPAARFFRPSRIMLWASRVAEVVPSPATSLVFVETSRMS